MFETKNTALEVSVIHRSSEVKLNVSKRQKKSMSEKSELTSKAYLFEPCLTQTHLTDIRMGI